MTEAEQLIQIIEEGRTKEVCAAIKTLLDSGYDPQRIIQECVMPALENVGRRFETQEIYITEMLMAARTVSTGNEYLKKKMNIQLPISRYKVVIGTVKDDLHFIGKNLVAMSMRSLGIEVVDLGVDVPPEQFVLAAESDPNVRIVAISALLTTTLPVMKKTVKALKNCKAAERINIMVGGGPVTETFANSIGADYYTKSAYEAAMVVKDIVNRLAESPGPRD